jgi:hypothetical protein
MDQRFVSAFNELLRTIFIKHCMQPFLLKTNTQTNKYLPTQSASADSGTVSVIEKKHYFKPQEVFG